MLWDLLQQLQLQKSEEHASSLDERVARLERQLGRTNDVLSDLIRLLEDRIGQDLDGDGRVG